jgi:hypothetical protein
MEFNPRLRTTEIISSQDKLKKLALCMTSFALFNTAHSIASTISHPRLSVFYHLPTMMFPQVIAFWPLTIMISHESLTYFANHFGYILILVYRMCPMKKRQAKELVLTNLGIIFIYLFICNTLTNRS